MSRLKLIPLTASMVLAMAFNFSCTSSDEGEIPVAGGSSESSSSNGGSSKSDCIDKELNIKANTLDDVVAACNAIRSEVLAQLDNFGSCDKNGLSFGKPIGEMMSECDVNEIPVVGGSSSSRGGFNGGNSNFTSDVPKQLYLEGYPFNGNGEIFITLPWQDEYLRSFTDTLPIGIIQNGQVTIDWPDIDSKYFQENAFTSGVKEYDNSKADSLLDYLSCDGPCPDSVNLSGIVLYRGGLITLLSGRGSCRLRLTSETESHSIYYLSGSAKIIGTYSSACKVLYPHYCYGNRSDSGFEYKDCNRVGGSYIRDEQHCLSGGGTLVTADYCYGNYINIDNSGYNGNMGCDGGRYDWTAHYNVNISNGWNITWSKSEYNNEERHSNGYIYTSSEETKNAKWTAENCN